MVLLPSFVKTEHDRQENQNWTLFSGVYGSYCSVDCQLELEGKRTIIHEQTFSEKREEKEESFSV